VLLAALALAAGDAPGKDLTRRKPVILVIVVRHLVSLVLLVGLPAPADAVSLADRYSSGDASQIAWTRPVFFRMASLVRFRGSLRPGTNIAELAVLGVCATFGRFLFKSACRGAPASVLAPANLTRLVLRGGLAGWPSGTSRTG
jgi:hypothetical protein